MQQEKASSKAEYDRIEKQIKDEERKRDAITGGKSTSARAKQAEEVKKLEIQTFAEEIEEKKRMYELYERWRAEYGAQVADEQFKDLIGKNADYLSYVEQEIRRLEQMRDVGHLGDLRSEDKQDLDTLIGERNRLTGKQSGIDQFKNDLDEAKTSAESLLEYLQFLDAVMNGLDGDKSILGSEKRLATATEKLNTEKALKEDLRAFLQEVAGSEERRAAIEAKYAQKRATLNKLVEDGKVIDHKKALAAIDAAEKKELDDDTEEVRKKSKEYKALLKIAEKHQDELTKLDVQAAREDFKRLTEGMDKESQEYKEHYDKLIDVEDKFRNKRIKNLEAVANAAGQIGSAMQNLGGDWADIGNVLMVAADQVHTISKAIGDLGGKDGKSGKGGFDIKNITSVVSLVTQVLGLLFTAIKRVHEETANFDNNRYDFRTQYGIAQNKKVGDKHSDNPFISDYNGMIKAGVDQYQDALKQYNEAIANLEEGNAVTGYRSGFLVRKSRRLITDDLLKTYPDLVDAAGNLNKELAQTLIATNQVDDMTKKLLETAIAWSDQVEEANSQIMDSIISMTGMIGNDLTDALVNAFKAGEDGAKAMSNVVGGVIESLVKQTTLLEIFRPMMDEFSAGVKESLSTGGDGTILDDLARLNGKLPDAYKIAEQIMSEMQNYGKENGMSIFEQSAGAAAGGSAAKGYIQGVTEQTVSQLVGQSNAIRIYQGEMNNNMRISVGHLSGILNNTTIANRHLARVESLLDDIKKGQYTRI